MVEFPSDFLWGAATSAHQVEGNTTDNDWWDWERRGRLKEASGNSCRQYEYYAQDFALAKELNHSCHRLSIEWSRIEPCENEFSLEAIEHYRRVIASLRSQGLEPVVTLHHFTNPLWFARLGGWLNAKAPFYFLRFIEKIVEPLSDEVKFWITINEPQVYAYHAFIIGVWPPGEKSFTKASSVEANMGRAHLQAYRLIRAIYGKKNLPSPLISLAFNMMEFIPCGHSLADRLGAYLRDRAYNRGFLEKMIARKSIDFIGLNYYTRSVVQVKGWRMRNFLLDTQDNNKSRLEKNCMGWDIYPQGLYSLLRRCARYGLAVFILENGVCTDDDALRWRFIRDHLLCVYQAMEEGVKVLGYLYWSLLDNYEWDKGFAPRFGLIEVDYRTFARTVRESARQFALVAKTGRLFVDGSLE